MEDKIQSFFNSSLIRLLGFIADVIAISSINIGLKADNEESLPSFISPGFAFAIWIIAFYTYTCILYDRWKKHKDSKEYSNRFKLFLVEDLLLDFGEPLYLLPAIILIIVLFWIAITADRIQGNESEWTLSLIIALLVVGFFLASQLIFWRNKKITPKTARQIDQSWSILEAQIYNLLFKKDMKLNKNDIEFVLRANGLPVRESVFDYIFRRISLESEDPVLLYGIIYNLQEEKLVTTESSLVAKDCLLETWVVLSIKP
jgi:tryptophan-rich sensory protein